MKAFTRALESLEKPMFAIGRIAPTAGLVDQYFNESTGEGDYGDIDTRGPWNEGDEKWQLFQAKALETTTRRSRPAVYAESSDLADPDDSALLLRIQLHDIPARPRSSC